MIELKDVKKGYQSKGNGKTPILDVSYLSIEKGEQLVITGPSGCGKSTLLHIIGGVIDADEGRVQVYGQDLTELKGGEKDQFRSKYIGYIFQDLHLIPSLTAEENILLAIQESIDKKTLNQLLGRWFDRVGLGNKRKSLPSQLSRGQQQRVALIRALIHKPAIVLADEPTGSLDVETGKEMMDLMIEVCKELETTFLCVTHDLELALKFPRKSQLQSLNESSVARSVMCK